MANSKPTHNIETLDQVEVLVLQPNEAKALGLVEDINGEPTLSEAHYLRLRAVNTHQKDDYEHAKDRADVVANAIRQGHLVTLSPQEFFGLELHVPVIEQQLELNPKLELKIQSFSERVEFIETNPNDPYMGSLPLEELWQNAQDHPFDKAADNLTDYNDFEVFWEQNVENSLPSQASTLEASLGESLLESVNDSLSLFDAKRIVISWSQIEANEKDIKQQDSIRSEQLVRQNILQQEQATKEAQRQAYAHPYEYDYKAAKIIATLMQEDSGLTQDQLTELEEELENIFEEGIEKLTQQYELLAGQINPDASGEAEYQTQLLELQNLRDSIIRYTRSDVMSSILDKEIADLQHDQEPSIDLDPVP